MNLCTIPRSMTMLKNAVGCTISIVGFSIPDMLRVIEISRRNRVIGWIIDVRNYA